MIIIISLVSVISALLSLLTRSSVFSIATLLLCLIVLGSIAISQFKRKTLAVTDRQTINTLKTELSQQQELIERVLPVLQILQHEDAVIQRLSGLNFPATPQEAPSATPRQRLETLIASFSHDRSAALARMEGFIPLKNVPDSLQEIKLRMPYIDLLLQRVVQYTESVVMTLLERFSAISEQSESGARDATKAMRSLGVGAGIDNTQSLERLIQESHESIVNRAAVIQEFLDLNKENMKKHQLDTNRLMKTEI